ncbi:MAG TPA: hypothetical protein PKC18_01495, partial [Lacipirellulaceae bacterium]|nr:hypothetical protein [Lacipirellulaceae bacterium]
EQVVALEAELQQSRDEAAELRRQFADLEAQVAQLEGGAAAETQALVEQLAAAESQTEALRKQLAEAEGERLKLALSSAEVESVVAELRKGLAAAEKRAQAAETRAIEAEHHAAAAADAPELREQLAAALAAAEERTQLTQGLQETLEEARRELDELRATMAPRAEFERLQQELQARVELVEQLQQASAAHETAVAALEAEVARLHSATAAGEERLRAASVERDQARAELAEVEQNSRPASELAEVQQKFDLALADVRKLKREIEGLREELASRPAAAGDAAPELVALRTERDALAARVAELETQYAAGANAADADAQQELADLQRRFEMAVDDVRQLKQENAQLREQIASQVAATPSAAAGGTDWAAQRARLMALLEEEEGSGELDPQRTAERVDIEQAIAATDRAVAEKDQRIAELQAALEASHAGRADAQAEADVARVLDADSVVAAERERLAALTAEWEEKVRAAELEFSVERAKLAREQAALREKMFEMEKLHPAPTQGDDGGDPHKPRRRWLSALGLQDDGDVGKSRK